LPQHGRILVVEDEEDIRSVLEMFLEMSGYEVSSAGDGREALDMLTSGEPLPDLILLDLMMPVMNGWQFRTAQRANPALSAIPTAVLSGGMGLKAHEESLGDAECLPKPVDLDELFRLIDRYVH
jgi:CheY-like chemotaxis protein